MQPRPLGNTGFRVSPLGFGAFKIGRNEKVKYPQPYDLPGDDETDRLLNGILDAGISYIDTAPAYGISEERIGRFLSQRRSEFVLSTKVGETFANGESSYDFSAAAVRHSVERSRERLQSPVLDVVYIHSNGDDLRILHETDAVEVLRELKQAGTIRAIGFSGKTVEGARAALEWADVIMVEYHINDRSHELVIAEAAGRGIGVVVKKGLSAGRLPPADAVRFVLGNAGVSSLIVGGLNLDHIRANITVAEQLTIQDTR
jgi:aryl-alcohol dehydrogenase-like predicted oxidoreductase